MIRFVISFVILMLIAAPTQGEVIDSIIVEDEYTMTLEQLSNGTKFIRVDGAVGNLFGHHLTTLIRRNLEIDYIELYSVGGYIDEIAQPGAVIRKHAIPVRVRTAEVCISSCAYLALYSPDITIHGQLAFHLAYMRQFDMTQTLYEISQSNVTHAILTTRTMSDNKWSLLLYYLISLNSDLTNYVVFDDVDDLNLFRITDLSEFVADFRIADGTEIRNWEEMQSIIEEQYSNIPRGK
jgi:hypothetical protein